MARSSLPTIHVFLVNLVLKAQKNHGFSRKFCKIFSNSTPTTTSKPTHPIILTISDPNYDVFFSHFFKQSQKHNRISHSQRDRTLTTTTLIFTRRARALCRLHLRPISWQVWPAPALVPLRYRRCRARHSGWRSVAKGALMQSRKREQELPDKGLGVFKQKRAKSDDDSVSASHAG